MSNQTNDDISVIICAYTEQRWLELLDAVESIQKQSMLPREIILVIDHNPRLLERLQAQLTGVTIIENIESRGLSGARNSGISIARGSLIAFLDDDATAEVDWLERLCKGCQDPKVLGTGGYVEPRWMGEKPSWFPKEFYWVIGCSYQDFVPGLVEVRNPYGGCTCMRREIFETVGGFCKGIGRIGNHPLGGEETELSIRAKQHWPERIFLCDAQARIHHCVSVERAHWRYFLARCYAEGLSKATIASLVGAKDSLASERSYTVYMLPRGIVRGLRDGIFKLDPAGFLRTFAIVAGLFTTTMGYLMGNIYRYRTARKGEEQFKAVYEPLPLKN